MQIICIKESKLWQLSICSVIYFTDTFKCFLQAENSMTGRAYMGEVMIKVYPKPSDCRPKGFEHGYISIRKINCIDALAG